MDQARKLQTDETAEGHHGAPRLRRDDQDTGLAGLDKVLRFALTPREQAQEPPREREMPARRDWSAALDLVHDAAEAIRITEERAQAMESRAQTLAERATEELQAAVVRIQAAEARAKAAEARALEAEARAKEAETRAKDAEAWLVRLHDVIVEELPSRRASLLQGPHGPAVEPAE